MMVEFQAARGGGGGPSHLTTHEEGRLQSPLGEVPPPTPRPDQSPPRDGQGSSLVRWDGKPQGGLSQRVVGDLDSNPDLP